MKRLIILLLSALMSMIGLKAFAHDIEVANNDGVTIYYIWDNEAKTELAVSWCGLYYESHYDYIGNVIIPESVEYNGNTYPVTSIGWYAFYGCSGLTSVTIPNSVTSIGDHAFNGCSGLTSVTIPNSVTSIGGCVFYGCSGLTSVTIPNSVTDIGGHAFQGCSGLTSVTIPNSVTEIRDGVFRECRGLTSVTIPNSVTDIGSEAFYACGLTSVTIPNSVTHIGKNAFAYCSLTSVKVPVTDYSAFCNNKHIDFIRRAIGKPVQLIDSEEAEITVYIVPNDVTSIGRSAFSGCRGLTSVSIPNSVTSIGSEAFSGCSGLTSVSIPNSVTSIGSEAFSGCSGLTSVIIGSGVLSIGSSAFSNTNLKKTIWLTNTPPSGYNYAKGTVNYVSNDQFNIDNKIVYKFLSSIFVVDGIRYVPVSPSDRTCDAIDCLYNESSENVNIGQTITNKGITLIVKKVNPYTCYGNNYIKEVNLSLSGDIGENAFWGCNALNTATINNQGHIGEKSFSGCTALNTLTISNQGDIGADAFSGCESISSARILNVGNIGAQAFYNCKALETAEIGKSVTSIGEKAFYDCSKLKGVILPDAVTTIGSYAFSGCQAMTSVKMGNGLKTIDQCAFKGCSDLPSITIPQAVTNINDYAFSGCTSLKEFRIADSDTELTIGSNGNNPIFSSCPLETVYIGRNINYNTSSDYGYSPFYRNTSLKTVKITDKETEISENEFYGCTNLQSVTIGDGVTTIGNWAFSGCQSLKYFAFGSQVQSIGQEAFSDCSAVVEISSKATTPPTCGSQALDDINKWECRLFVPEGCMATYQGADQWKDFFFTDEGEGTSGQNPDDPSIDNPDGKKCEAPTISVVGGKIKFDCNTNGVLYHYNITCLDVKDGVINTSEVEIHKTYRISVYASKDGYDDSATTTKDIKMTSDGDLNDDGEINVADVVELTNIIMGQEPK